MIAVIEILMLLAVVLVSVVMFRHSFSTNLIGTMLRVGGCLVGCSLAIVLFRWGHFVSGNLVLSLVVGVLLGWMLGRGVKIRMRRRSQERDWCQRLDRRLRLPGWLDRGLTGGLVLLVWGGAFLSTLVASEIVSLSPTTRAMALDTWLLKHFVAVPGDANLVANENRSRESTPADENEFESNRRASVDQVKLEQQEFFSRFSAGVRQTKQQLYDVTGLDEFKQEIDLARQIINLPSDDKLWLLTHHPQLVELIDHPAMVRVLENRPLMARLERFADGRMEEVLFIGSDRDIQHLLDDREIKELVRDIDLEQMLRQCQARQTATTDSVE